MAPSLGVSYLACQYPFQLVWRKTSWVRVRARGWWEIVVSWVRAVSEGQEEGTIVGSMAGFAGQVDRPAGTGQWVQHLLLEHGCLRWFMWWLRERWPQEVQNENTPWCTHTHAHFSNLNLLTTLTFGPLKLRVNWDLAHSHCREWWSQMLCFVALLFSEGPLWVREWDQPGRIRQTNQKTSLSKRSDHLWVPTFSGGPSISFIIEPGLEGPYNLTLSIPQTRHQSRCQPSLGNLI